MAIGNLIIAAKPWKSWAMGTLTAFGFVIAAWAAIYLTGSLSVR